MIMEVAEQRLRVLAAVYSFGAWHSAFAGEQSVKQEHLLLTELTLCLYNGCT
jgi:hypothetical protein